MTTTQTKTKTNTGIKIAVGVVVVSTGFILAGIAIKMNSPTGTSIPRPAPMPPTASDIPTFKKSEAIGITKLESLDWKIIDTGDFSDDKKADILWQDVRGVGAIWTMDGTTQKDYGELGLNPGKTWKAIGSGDFNGDGKSDILWQNTDGRVSVWLMDGVTVKSSNTLTGNPGTAWKVIGSGDFDNDSKSDILLQNTDGRVSIWLMDGVTVKSGNTLATNPGTAWKALRSGDFDSDGKSDLLWQNTDGRVAIWMMDGKTIKYSGTLALNLGKDWKLISASDFDGDKKLDLLFQSSVDGQAAIRIQEAKCTDSDGGKDYYIRGTAGYSRGELSYDYCYTQDNLNYNSQNDSGTGVREVYCKDDGMLEVENFICPNGCKDGACVQVNPAISVTSPSGGETWKAEETHNVTWTASNVEYVKIYIHDSNIVGSGSTDYITLDGGSVPAGIGSYSWTIGKPHVVAPGTNYKIQIDAVDKAGNVLKNSDGKEIIAFSNVFSVASTVADTAPPKIVSLKVSPYEIDTTSQYQVVTFTANITDDSSGVDSREGQCDIAVNTDGYDVIRSYKLTQVSGDNKNGVYTVSITIPKFAPPGLWKVYDVSVRDNAGNYKSYYYQDLSNQGLDLSGLSFFNKSTDLTSPNLHLLSISPTTINTATQDQTLNLSMTLTDNVNAGNGTSTEIGIGTGGISQVYFKNFSITTSSGSGTYVTYKATAVIPKGSAGGNWSVTHFRISDWAGNVKTYSYPELKSSGYNTGLDITNSAN